MPRASVRSTVLKPTAYLLYALPPAAEAAEDNIVFGRKEGTGILGRLKYSVDIQRFDVVVVDHLGRNTLCRAYQTSPTHGPLNYTSL